MKSDLYYFLPWNGSHNIFKTSLDSSQGIPTNYKGYILICARLYTWSSGYKDLHQVFYVHGIFFAWPSSHYLVHPFLFDEKFYVTHLGFPGVSASKVSARNAGDVGSIPGLGRSPGGGNGYPHQYSGLENSMDCIVHGVAKSQIWLSHFHFLYSYGFLTLILLCV